MRIVFLAAAVLTALHSVPASAACEAISMQGERERLTRFLGTGGLDGEQVDFLVGGTVERADELTSTGFNDRGKTCGLDHVRASVLGCVNAMMAGRTLSQIRTGKSAWGKSDVTRAELLVVGFVHACRGGALDAFYVR